MIITPSGAGAGPDVITRIVADRLTERWGRQVLVVNRPGGGGLIAAQAISTAERDGYTLYLPITSTFVVLPEVQPKMPLDLQRDVVPIGLVAEQPMVIAVHPSLGVNTLAELIALAKQKPGKILYGAGRGTLPHLTGEMFSSRANVELSFIPYPTAPKAMQDAIGGTLSMFIESMSAVAGPMQAGSLKVLAAASAKRLANFADLPTVAEAVPGLAPFEARGWFALAAPSGTPEAIVCKVNEDLRAALEQPDVRKKLEVLGSYARPTSPAETAEFIRGERELWRPIVRKIAAASQ
jgi:putative tricarboxylic transport membrane protein